jgi:hypothetical protein
MGAMIANKTLTCSRCGKTLSLAAEIDDELLRVAADMETAISLATAAPAISKGLHG